MNAIDFLKKYFEDTPFVDATPEDIEAVRDFTLLWSAFEGAILNGCASPDQLTSHAKVLADLVFQDELSVNEAIGYFRNRYWHNGHETRHMHYLHLHRYNQTNIARVMSFLDGTGNEPEMVIAGLLLVIYRLRNNLFHGPKWEHGLVDQRNNFSVANSVLMAALRVGPRNR